MSTLAFVGPLQVTLPVATDLAPLAAVVLGGGLVGMSIRNMFESIMSEEDEGEATSPDGAEAGGGLMAAEDDDDGGGGEDMGGLGGLEDDGDDDLGDFDEGFDDGFDDMDDGGAGGDLDELQHRLDEMEAEVGSLSSTVNTVRNENEQISESVAEVEENVRKLLDIYEMVTRGVNPFADDVDAGMGGGMGDGGGFGLFEDDGGGETQQVDEDIAEADAEGFFDEDLVDDEDDLEADADVDDVLEDDGETDFDEEIDDDFDEDFEDDFDDEPADDDGGGGTSFEDLKAEYESGEADWTDEDLDDDAGDEEEFAEDFEDDLGEEDAADDGAGATAEAVDETADALAEDDLFDDVIEEDSTDSPEPDATQEPADPEPAETTETVEPERAEAAATTEPDPEPAEATGTAEPEPTEATATADPEPAAEPATDAAGQATGTEESGKPYLESLPGGYATDLLVFEWLESLVEEAGVRDTAGAIDYYETIDWIGPDAADELEEYLAGFDDGGNSDLTIDHHARSLRYIGELNGGGVDAVATGRLTDGGGTDGVQR